MLALFRHGRPAARGCFHTRWLSTKDAAKVKLQLSSDLTRLEAEHAKVLKAVKAGHDASLTLAQTNGQESHTDVAALKQRKALRPLADAWAAWSTHHQNLTDALSLLSAPDDADLSDLAHAEAREALTALSTLLPSLPELLLPPSPTANMSAMLELKSAVGGAESSLFLKELLGVYMRFASAKGFEPQLVGAQDLDQGGVKDAILEVSGAGAYDALKWESGVHRVQRVPATESAGRVHTSTVAVVVLPLADEPANEADEELFKMEDVRLEVMRARGAGGQHVNKTESAVRLTHIPTGITVSMQDERSQHQNRRRAFQVLRARLMDIRILQQQADHRAQRRGLVSKADRSEKIRTYNEPQDRVTDHRLGKVHFSWEDVVQGTGLEMLVEDLRVKAGAEELEARLDPDSIS